MTNPDANEAKASFEALYTQPDPRAYFSVLGALDYSIPDLARPIFRQLAAAWRMQHGRSATLLDLGSSYGVNSALFRYPVSFDLLRRRYACQEMMALSSAEVRALDHAFYRSWPRAQDECIIAADVATPAVDYAVAVGLADDGVACNLEDGVPPAARRKLRNIDIIMSTGAVGYVTERTFDALLRAADARPWVISFVLRMFDYGSIAQRLAAIGLVTEKLESVAFVQRRFKDEAEARRIGAVLRARGLEPSGLEGEGLLIAELFVSRPEVDVAAAPLPRLVKVLSGRNLNLGPRLVHVPREGRPPILVSLCS